jgi:hypothetical protein
VTHGAATILASATESATEAAKFSWELALAILAFVVNGVWSYANAQRTRASENLKTADANKDKAIEAKFEAVLAAVNVVTEKIDGVHRRLDSHDDDIETLREKDNRLEVQVAKDFARLEAKLDNALARKEGARA